MHPPTADDHSLRPACIRETSEVRPVPADPLEGAAPPVEDSQPHLNRAENRSPRACSLLNHSIPPHRPTPCAEQSINQRSSNVKTPVSVIPVSDTPERGIHKETSAGWKPAPALKTSFFQPVLFRACIARSRSQNHVRTLCFQCSRTDPMKNGNRRVATRRIRSTLRTSTVPQPHHSDRLRTNHPREPKLNPRSPDAPRKTGEGRSTAAHA